jgi:CRP-like cAMP-binding protein
MINPLITRLRLQTRLSEDSLNTIANACTTTRFYPGRTDIVPEGHGTEDIHIVLSGWCCRFRFLSDGRRQFPALLLPGDICDLDGLLTKHINFGIATLTPCTVASLPHDKLRAIMDQDGSVREALWWLTVVENSIATEWTVGLGRRSTRERLAHLICELLVRLTTVELARGHDFILPMTQEELGDALGISTVHVNRTLQDLRGKGLIKLDGNSLTICDWDALKTLGGFTPGYLHSEGWRMHERNMQDSTEDANVSRQS